MKNNENLFVRKDEKRVVELDTIEVKPYSYWRSVFREFFKKKIVYVALFMFFSIIFLTLFGLLIHRVDVFGLSGPRNALPNPYNWFGTNQNHKDIWTEIWKGSQTTFRLAIVVVAINVTIGLLVGALWGYFRKLDIIMIEFRNIVYNLPTYLIYVIILFVFQERGFWVLVFCLTMFGWLGLASALRDYIIIFNNREYNIASRTLGTRPLRLVIHNILPQLTSYIVIIVFGMFTGVIGSEVSLSYLGLGFTGDVVSLGTVLNGSYASDWLAFPHIIFFPAAVLAMLTISLYLIGINLSDACDPRTHR